MPQISDEKAKAFAKALITCGGNRTQAAISLGYKPGPCAQVGGSDLARNPKVIKHLQPMVIDALQALTPKAVVTLGALLKNKSGYIRLEAVKDILNRNGIGMSKEPVSTGQLVVNINIRKHDDVGRICHPPQIDGNASDISDLAFGPLSVPTLLPTSESSLADGEGNPPSDEHVPSLLDLDEVPTPALLGTRNENTSQAQNEPGGPKRERTFFATSTAHDFSQKVSSPAHDFSAEVPDLARMEANKVSLVLEEEVEASGEQVKIPDIQ